MSTPLMETNERFLDPNSLNTIKLRIDPHHFVVHSHGVTDQGRRSSNQDQFVIAQLIKTLVVQATSFEQPSLQQAMDRGHLFIVADGVGGSAGGQEASAFACDSLEHFMLDTLKWFFELRGEEEVNLLKEFQQALGHADARLFAESLKRPELRGMGTTATMALILEDRLFVAHAGDSRCYLLRGDMLFRLTHDHTMTEEMVAAGYIKPEEAEKHPFRNVLTNSLGGSTPGVRVEVHKVPVESADVMLLCSDGLIKVVKENEIRDLLQRATSPKAACDELMQLAKERNADDNVTLIVARLEAKRCQ